MSEFMRSVPRWAVPFDTPSRYLAAFGGRSSGKSHEFGGLAIEKHVENPNRSTVCIREVQKSLKLSVKRLLENKIREWALTDYFEITESEIRSTRGNGQFAFTGMQNHTAESIKSLEDFDCAWVEEAQTFSQRSLDLLRPTIRKPGSELWFSWNPRFPTDPVDQLFRGGEPPPRSTIVNVNFDMNPWITPEALEEMEYDKIHHPEKFAHIWLGGYQTNSDAQVFTNWRVEEFETDKNAIFRFGADWGFSKDPTVLIRCYIEGRTIYVDYEAYKIGCEIMDTPSLFHTIPQSERWPMTADSARPETISYMRTHGFPKIQAAVKGAGSIEEGIEWLKTYEIVVHPRCTHLIDEVVYYSYKRDPLTDQVLPILQDKYNHVIDALRYALESARRSISTIKVHKAKIIPTTNRWRGR